VEDVRGSHRPESTLRPRLRRPDPQPRGHRGPCRTARLGHCPDGEPAEIPQDFLLPHEPPEARNLIEGARDPGKRWYGVYANYNTPAYNTKLVKPYLENAYAMVKIKDTDDIILKQVFISLGVFLDMISNAKYPRTFNKLTLLLPEELKAFAPWVVQLIHESLGKNGKGIEVLFGEELTPDMANDFIRQGRVFLRV